MMSDLVLPPSFKTETTGIMIVDHGSRRVESNRRHEEFVVEWQTRYRFRIVEPAHMEFAEPSIRSGFEACGRWCHDYCNRPILSLAGQSLGSRHSCPRRRSVRTPSCRSLPRYRPAWAAPIAYGYRPGTNPILPVTCCRSFAGVRAV